MSTPAVPALRIGVVGSGRVGAVLGAALVEAGHRVVATSATSEASRARAEELLPQAAVLPVEEVVNGADLVLLAVPDDELAGLVQGLAVRGAWDVPRIVVHTSGAHGLDVLQPVVEGGGMALAIHPAFSFTGSRDDLDRLPGSIFAITGTSETLMLAQALVLDLGGEPVLVPEEDRLRYHAALTHGAQHLITVIAQAQQVLRECGVEDPSRALRPLVDSAVEAALERGDRASAGPVPRGDVGTVRGHLEALRDDPADIAQAYRALARATTERAARRREVPRAQVGPLTDALGDAADPRRPDEGPTSA